MTIVSINDAPVGVLISAFFDRTWSDCLGGSCTGTVVRRTDAGTYVRPTKRCRVHQAGIAPEWFYRRGSLCNVAIDELATELEARFGQD